MLDMRHVEWVLQRQNLGTVFNDAVMITGDGPLSSKRMKALLELARVETGEIDSQYSILVIGRRDWDTDALDDLLEDRVGDALYCYSQEMALMVLLSGMDPYLEEGADVEALGAGHPGLERLASFGFEWPQAVVNEGIEPEDSPEASSGSWGSTPLSARGYSVKRGGPAASQRRQILTDVYTKSLADLAKKFDLTEWGSPKSGERLWKIADTIVRNHNIRARQYKRAAKKWREDLQWLKETHYVRGRISAWPKPFVQVD